MHGLGVLFDRLRRVHPLAWVASLLAAVVMTLLIVPAGYDRFEFDEYHTGTPTWWQRECRELYAETEQLIKQQQEALPPDSSNVAAFVGVTPQVWQHGWPMPYLARSQPAPMLGGYRSVRSEPLLSFGNPRMMCNGQATRFVSWSNYDNWPLESVAWRIHPGGLLLNVTIWLAVVAGIGYAGQTSIAFFTHAWRFRLLSLLTIFTIGCIGFGWLGNRLRVARLEHDVNTRFINNGNPDGLGDYRAYTGPVWLARLAGDDEYLAPLALFRNRSVVDYVVGPDWRQDLSAIARLPYLEDLRLVGNVPVEAVELLAGASKLEYVSIRSDPNSAAPPPSDEGPLVPERLSGLAKLPIRGLLIESNQLLAEDIEQLLANSETLEHLSLQSPAITDAEIADLKARYPNVGLTFPWRGDESFAERQNRVAEVRKARGK
jgi:hypothetical protein